MNNEITMPKLMIHNVKNSNRILVIDSNKRLVGTGRIAYQENSENNGK